MHSSNYKLLDIQTNFKEIKSCTVCAIGGCILSTTKFANKLIFQDLNGDLLYNNPNTSIKINKLLTSVFSVKELALIERCFEGHTNVYTEKFFQYSLTDKARTKCCDFYESRRGNSEQILVKIMKKIAKEGKFQLN